VAQGLLGKAADTLTEHPDVSEQNVPDYLHSYDLRTLTEQSAGCYQVTGRAEEAVIILEQTIASMNSSLARDRGHLTAKLAVALTRTRTPEPERAAALGLQALAVARDTGSARILAEVHTLSSRLTARWSDHPASREVRDALAAQA
jgi:hypothetical protein